MAMPTRPLSPAGQALGLGDLLAGQVSDETDELRKRRQLQLGGRPDLSASLGYGSSVLGGAAAALGFGRLR